MIQSHHDGYYYAGTTEASSTVESQDTDDKEAEQELSPSHRKLVLVLADIFTIILNLLLNGEI